MKVLFVMDEVFLPHPIGVMLLSAALKKHGHATKLFSIRRHGGLLDELDAYQPEIIAYSAMSPGIDAIQSADRDVQRWIKSKPEIMKRPVRIMGGPHPTFFPSILHEMNLDAICVGEGDHAFPELAARVGQGAPLAGIPNILTPDQSPESMKKELVAELDSLPFADQDLFYDAVPVLRDVKLASVLTGRGCPYFCTYCFNHAYNKLFKSCGPVLRKRSVDNVFAEIKEIIARRPNTGFIRFADDTFIHKIGEWEEEFFARYKKEIGLPFYCLMRSNTLSERAGRELKAAGCVSIGMALESGSERIRNVVLKRGISDEMVRRSFAVAHRNKLTTYGNAMFGLPEATLEDDFKSVRMMKEIKMSVPTFGFFSPFPGTELTDHGIKLGLFREGSIKANFYTSPPDRADIDAGEMRFYANFLALSPIFCKLPWAMMPWLKRLSALPLGAIYRLVSRFFLTYQMRRLFPGIYPRDPYKLLKLFVASYTSLKTSRQPETSTSGGIAVNKNMGIRNSH